MKDICFLFPQPVLLTGFVSVQSPVRGGGKNNRGHAQLVHLDRAPTDKPNFLSPEEV